MWQIDMFDLNMNTSCYDSILEAMLKSFGFEYQFFNLKKFSPNHIITDENGRNVIIRGIKNNNILYDIFNVKTIFLYEKDIDNLQKLIKDNIIKSPVGAFVNAIDCKWTIFYKKQMINHFLLIVDIDELNKTYKCIDNYYPTNGFIELKFNEIEKLFEKIVLFEFGENKTNIANIPFYLKEYISIPDQISFENEKNKMIDYILNLSIENMGCIETVYHSPLLLKLKWMAEDKIDFANSLKYYDKTCKHKVFIGMYSTLEFIANEINMLRNILIRYVLTGKVNADKIINYVDSIYKANYKICVDINNTIK